MLLLMLPPRPLPTDAGTTYTSKRATLANLSLVARSINDGVLFDERFFCLSIVLL